MDDAAGDHPLPASISRLSLPIANPGVWPSFGVGWAFFRPNPAKLAHRIVSE